MYHIFNHNVSVLKRKECYTKNNKIFLLRIEPFKSKSAIMLNIKNIYISVGPDIVKFSIFGYKILKISDNLIFYIKQLKSLSTTRQKHYFLNSWYYSNKLVTLHACFKFDGRAYGYTDGHTDGLTNRP